jgi:hypothetical protein
MSTKHGPTETTVTVEDSPGGTGRLLDHCDTINGMGTETITEKTNGFGSTAEGNTPAGVDKSPDLTLEGLLTTTALVGTWTVLKQVAGDKAVNSVGRLVTIVAATGATWTGHYHLVRTEAVPVNDKLTRYRSLFRPADIPFDGAWS